MPSDYYGIRQRGRAAAFPGAGRKAKIAIFGLNQTWALVCFFFRIGEVRLVQKINWTNWTILIAGCVLAGAAAGVANARRTPVSVAAINPPRQISPAVISPPTTDRRDRAFSAPAQTWTTLKPQDTGATSDDCRYAEPEYDGRRKTAWVSSYTRRNGTFVRSYCRRPPR